MNIKRIVSAGLVLLLAWSASAQDYQAICTSLSPTYEAAGFVCLSANSQQYLRCHLPELVWAIMDCPPTLRCTSPVMNWTEDNPCNYPPEKYCGDGVVDEGEECEIGGYGCGSDCMCELDFMPTVPVSKDCQKIPTCGNGVIDEGEQCEVGGVGCDTTCMCQQGYEPTAPVSKDCALIPFCGDGIVNNGEQCEIGGTGCSANCMCEEGYRPAEPAAKDCVLIPKCGNGVIDEGEQCEINGVGCSANCMCEEGFKPTEPVSKDCVPVPPQPKNLEDLCRWFTETDDDSGYVCLEDNATEYLRCHMTERVATMMPCPAGTRCRAPVDVYTVYNPCLWESPYPIEDYVWIYGDDQRTPDVPPVDPCGDGVLDDGEECEKGGIGCLSNCVCAAFYKPAEAPSIDCVLDAEMVCKVLFQLTNQPTLYVCPEEFLTDNSSITLRCDNGVPTIETCDAGTFCNAEGFFLTNPCAPVDVNKCGNGEINYDEQCEIGGAGCTAECKCAEGYRPTYPVSTNCVLDDMTTPEDFCAFFSEPGYFCEKYWTDAASNKFVMCDAGNAYKFDCPLGTVCGAPGFTQENPCVIDGICGNGVTDGSEQCEVGGYGCENCQCLPGFVPTDPVSANCKLATLEDVCREFDAWVPGASYYGCIPGLDEYYLKCDADTAEATVQVCPRGTECLVGAFTTEDPCL